MNKNYQKGRRFEYQVAKFYREHGWTVMRTAGSKGPSDLICLFPDAGLVDLVQCKVVATEAASSKLIKEFESVTSPYIDKVNEVIVVHVKGSTEDKVGVRKSEYVNVIYR